MSVEVRKGAMATKPETPNQFDAWAAPRSKFTPSVEEAKKNSGIEQVSKGYADLIAAGIPIAMRICEERGRVTSVEVEAEMLSDSRYASRMAEIPVGETTPERRWLGHIFQRGGWKRFGYEPTGSHGRPVSIWKRA
jgi:hypothetical protein